MIQYDHRLTRQVDHDRVDRIPLAGSGKHALHHFKMKSGAGQCMTAAEASVSVVESCLELFFR